MADIGKYIHGMKSLILTSINFIMHVILYHFYSVSIMLCVYNSTQAPLLVLDKSKRYCSARQTFCTIPGVFSAMASGIICTVHA